MTSFTMISVIITEYQNRGFLKYALSSVFNQTLSKDEYEVIVTKRFEDKELDDYARKNGAKVIYDDTKRSGEQIYNAVQETKGDILTFLDDDDMYREDRLAAIKRSFSRNIAGFHNRIIKIDAKGSILDSRQILPSNNKLSGIIILNGKNFRYKNNFFPMFNSSSLAIRRCALRDSIKEIEVTIDTYMIYEAVCNQDFEGLYLDPDSLTYYRVHTVNNSKSRSPLYWKRLYHDHTIIYDKYKNCSKRVEVEVKKHMLVGKRILYESEILNYGRSDISFTLDEIIFLLNPFNKISIKSSLLSLPATFLFMLPKQVRDNLVKLYVRRFGFI